MIALGGDGVIHEAKERLVKRPEAQRPTLGVIPVGSGNDYARTLGISGRGGRGVRPAADGARTRRTWEASSGCWFVETLSFGLDAAIALDTMERRVRTGRTGTILYMESGVDQLLHHLDLRRYRVSFDGGEPVEARSITFAVQIGPYYGGGFKICPDARIDDGLLDVCIAHPPVSAARALYIFLRAKDGKHVRFKQVELRQCRTLRVEFDEAPAAQMDGELIEGRAFDIAVVPHALNVLVP